MTELVDALAVARVPWTSPAIRAWYALGALRRNLRSAMADEAHRVADAGFGADFRDDVGIDGPEDPLAWANRRLDLPGDGWAVTGIRFRGRDSTRPFVDVVATTAAPTPDGLAVVAASVLPAYEEFAPLCLRVDAPEGPAVVAELRDDARFEAAGCAVDQHVVAGLVEQLRTQPRAGTYARVSLRAGEPSALAKRAAEIYRELAAREPELTTWASPEDVTSLSACADEGLLFEVLVDDVTAGVVAGLRDDAHAMTGFAVQELCLDAGHRGQRLAPAVVQRLVDELPADAGDVLWGTIDPANLPSLRNASSVGRTLVGGYVWVAPVGFPGMPAATVQRT
ncbi:MAG TPA: hypothetical protein VH228_15470 [Nocardioides sp.]|nr:hypothetical protein [Nocardioides sp.]